MPPKYPVNPIGASKGKKTVKRTATVTKAQKHKKFMTSLKRVINAKIMRPEIKAKWLDALRSGKYAQTNGALKKGDSYCCLGVLCDVYAKTRRNGSHFEKDVNAGWLFGRGEREKFVTRDGCESHLYLPEPVAKWAGIPPHTTTDSEQDDLANMNDEGKSFEEIADYIEKHL